MTCPDCKGAGRLPLSVAFAGICLLCHSTGEVPPPDAEGEGEKR